MRHQSRAAKLAFKAVRAVGLLVALGVLCLGQLSCESPVQGLLLSGASRAEPGVTGDSIEDVAALVNAARVSQGVHQLRWSLPLAQAAQQHAEDMAGSAFVSHIGSDGSELRTRMVRAGYSPRFLGEIIAWAAGGPQSALTWWWDSPLHRSTMLGASYVDYGAGVAAHPQHANQHYYVVVFGARQQQ